MNHRFLLILAAVFLPSATFAEPDPGIAPDNKHIKLRGDFRNLKHKLTVDKKCHVAFLGGSITQNTGGHTAMVPAWLRESFPDAEISVTNAGLGSTCSTSGAFRLGSHIFGGEPVDLLIVEFAVNDDQDAAHARRGCIRGMEGIVRQVHRDHPLCDLVMVHYVNPSILDKASKGEASISVSAHEDVAKHHGVTSVDVAGHLADTSAAGKYGWKEYGGTHPKPFGYKVASNMITTALKSGLDKAPAGAKPEPHNLKPAIDQNSYDQGTFVAPDSAKTGEEWRIGKVGREMLPLGGIRKEYTQYDVLRADKPGATLTLDFEGRGVGMFILAGPDAGMVEASIDGSRPIKHDLFHRHSGGLNYPRSIVFGADLKPGKHTLILKISSEKNARSKGNAASILFFEVNR